MCMTALNKSKYNIHVLIILCSAKYCIEQKVVCIESVCSTYWMNPPAKKEGNSRQRRLGWPRRVDSTRHLSRDVVCSDS